MTTTLSQPQGATNGASGGSNAELAPRLQAFLRTQVNTFVKWDVVRFFWENPHVADTGEQIAHSIGREPNDVLPSLRELADSGLLVADESTGARLYRFSPRGDMRALTEQFLMACDDRELRLQAIQHMMSAAK